MRLTKTCKGLLLVALLLTPWAAAASNAESTMSDVDRLVAGNTRFASDLYQALSAQPGNLVFSPFSISQALAMTWAGAAGDTEREISSTLHFDLPQERLHLAFSDLRRQLTDAQGDGIDMDLVSAVWGQSGYGFLPPYLRTLSESYAAGTRAVDFRRSPEEARHTINLWARDQTRGTIEEVVPPGVISSLTRLVLVNAMHFHGDWEQAFDPAATREGAFTRLDGSQVQVPMMGRRAELRSGRGDGYQLVELPYSGGQLSMVVVLPDPGEHERVERVFAAEGMAGLTATMQTADNWLAMPRFRCSSPLRLGTTLASMGMPQAFDENLADLSRINGARDLVVEDVVHHTVLAVDEKGTEAAVVSSSVVRQKRGPAPIRVDRPFLFMVRDNATGTILLMGRVLDPSV